MKDLLSNIFKNYFNWYKKEFNKSPRLIVKKGMTNPVKETELCRENTYADWLPQESRVILTPSELEEVFGEPINETLYQYYYPWRFGKVDFFLREPFDIHITLLPIVENFESMSTFFFSYVSNEKLFFHIGDADGNNSDYIVSVDNTTGEVYIKDLYKDEETFIADNILDLLMKASWN